MDKETSNADIKGAIKLALETSQFVANRWLQTGLGALSVQDQSQIATKVFDVLRSSFLETVSDPLLLNIRKLLQKGYDDQQKDTAETDLAAVDNGASCDQCASL